LLVPALPPAVSFLDARLETLIGLLLLAGAVVALLIVGYLGLALVQGGFPRPDTRPHRLLYEPRLPEGGPGEAPSPSTAQPEIVLRDRIEMLTAHVDELNRALDPDPLR
jgi:hypothetical protein